MCPEAERSFDNTYSGKRGQPFDVPDSSKVTSPGCLLPQKVYSNRPLRFLRIPRWKCHCPK